MTDREQLNLTEFDYVMAAVNEYVQERNVDKNMLWNIIDTYKTVLSLLLQ